MYIEFKDRKLKKICEDFSIAQKIWGRDIAYKLVQRINEMQAAKCLEDLNYLPPTRCHPLKGDRKGQFAVDLKQPFRLIFEPILSTEEFPTLSSINKIRIMEVIDYHE